MDLKEFDIEIFSLGYGSHSYQYSIENSFWSHFDYGLISKSTAKVNLTLEKSETLVKVDLQIKGILQLVCDRSLEEFDHPFEVEKALVFKYGIEEGELGADIYIINPSTSVINISQHLYEFIGLQVPIKKLHPRFQEAIDREQDEMVYRDKEGSDGVLRSTDPRWESLKKLRYDN